MRYLAFPDQENNSPLGRNVHDFLAETLFVGALPSITTTLKTELELLSPLVEPGFTMERFAAAARFFERVGYSHRVFLGCNDATAVRASITCRLQDNVLLGLGSLEDTRCGPTLQDIQLTAQRLGIATQVDVYLLCPLDPTLPSFVLGIFPQNGRVDSDIIAMRWAIIDDCLAHFGLVVIAHCADGDSSHLSAMQRRQYSAASQSDAAAAAAALPTYHLQPRTRVFSFSVPNLRGSGTTRVGASASSMPFLCANGTTELRLFPNLHFQDSAHLGTKLRMRLLGRLGHGLRIGSGIVQAEIFHKAFGGDYLLPEARLGLRRDDLDPKRDPMDVPAFLRLVSDDVLEYLRLLDLSIAPKAPPAPSVPPQAQTAAGNSRPTASRVPHSRGLTPSRRGRKRTASHAPNRAPATAPSPVPASTPAPAQKATALHLRAYLLMAHRAVLAFLNPKLEPLERIYFAWYARYFAEGWRFDCEKQQDITSNFLSANQYACIVLNAESLLLLLLWFVSAPEFRVLPFAPHAFGSQQAESFFRCLRAMFHDPNFTVENCLWRASYVQLEAVIQHRRANDFVFPHHRKHTHMDRVRHPAMLLPHIHEDQIAATLLRARDHAVTDLLALGVKLPEPVRDPAAVANPPPLSPPLDDDPEDAQLDNVAAEESELLPMHGDLGDDDASMATRRNEHWGFFLQDREIPAATPVWPISPTILENARKEQCIASRPSRIVPIPGSPTTVSDGAGGNVDKRRACAIVCMHPSISADRVKRVQKMAQKQDN